MKRESYNLQDWECQPGASLGVRAFEIQEKGMFFKDYTIRSITSNKVWDTEKHKAICGDGFDPPFVVLHQAPDKKHGCGFYSYKSFDLFNQFYSVDLSTAIPQQIPALIAQWGKVIETEYGVRSQYAKIIALVGNDKRLKRIAKQYDLPLVFPADIEEFAYEMGLEVLPLTEEEKVFGPYIDYSRAMTPHRYLYTTPMLMNRTYLGMFSKSGKSIYSIDGVKLNHVRIVSDIFGEPYASYEIINEGVKYEFPCLPWESKDDELYYYESYDHFMRQIDALFERNNPEELKAYRVREENEKI